MISSRSPKKVTKRPATKLRDYTKRETTKQCKEREAHETEVLRLKGLANKEALRQLVILRAAYAANRAAHVARLAAKSKRSAAKKSKSKSKIPSWPSWWKAAKKSKPKRTIAPKKVKAKLALPPNGGTKTRPVATRSARQTKVRGPVAPKARGFDAYLLKQTKKNHKYLVQTLKTRWRLSKSKNSKSKAKLAQLMGRPANPGEAGTSAQAFKSIDDRRAKMRTEIMKEIMLQGTHGSTTYEIEQALDMLHQTASARVYELTGQGRIVDSGRRRKTGSGRNAIVHIPADAGISLKD